MWYSVPYSGWIFSYDRTGTYDGDYDKFIQASPVENSGLAVSDFEFLNSTSEEVSGNNFYDFKELNSPDKRGDEPLQDPYAYPVLSGLNNKLSDLFSRVSRISNGLTQDEIQVDPKFEEFRIKDIESLGNSTTKISLYKNDLNYYLFSAVRAGTNYRLDATNSGSIYKVNTIKEENSLLYTVRADAYLGSKYAEIENTNQYNIKEEEKQLDFEKGFLFEENKYYAIDSPIISPSVIQRNSTRADVVLSWSDVGNATGYNVRITSPALTQGIEINTESLSYSFGVTVNASYYTEVTALGEIFNNTDVTTHYLNSSPGVRVVAVSVLDEDLDFSTSFVGGIQIN